MANAQAEKLFGYERTELLGEAMEMLVPERFRAPQPGLQHGFFAAPQARPMGAGRDLYGLRKDGSEVLIETGLSPIQTAEGHFVLASVIDITERKRTEERLRRFNAELERRVEEHTAELTESAAQLRSSLREREVLLQETHHRVKNNLQIVASLLSLQSADIRDPQLVAHFQESQGRIRSMALIHEKLYQSESLARVDLAEYMHSLVGNLFRTYVANDNVSLDVRLDPAPVSIDTAVPMGLLLNELVTNALKYAFPEGRRGCLLVALEAKPDGELVLRVEDDGVGMAPDFQFEHSKTLGLRLVRMLAKQLRAEVAFRSESGHTEFEIRFQEPAAKSA
jgi:PAS domain S-box-containing protein